MSGLSDSGSSTFSGPGPSRRLAYPTTNMEIELDNHYQAKVYTSGDSITGTVTITPQRNIPFDRFEIVLLGTAHTRVDNISSPIESSHVFLKLLMPISESVYPVPRVLEAYQTYTLPLHFVVPPHLTLSACNHKVESALLQDHHMRLPPTMGGGRGAFTAKWERDDLAPEMARIEYTIKARILRDGEKTATGSAGRTKIVEATHPLRILPVSIEDAPLSLTENDRTYKLRTAKTLRKGLLGPLLRGSNSKLGRITASTGDDVNTPQPAAIVLRPDGSEASPTTACVQLLFDPATPDTPPPRVTAVSAKLTAHTYFAAGPISAFPNLGDWSRHDNSALERRGSYTTSVPLLSQAVRDFQWEARVDNGRRDSGYCSSDDSEEAAAAAAAASGSGRRRVTPPSPSKEVGIVYAAQLVVPVELPLHKKMFVPTFHSCIASRTYSLQLAVSVAPGSTTSSSGRDKKSKSDSATTLNLAVPVQIVVGDGGQPQQPYMDLPSFETALEEADADAHLLPRVLAVPEAEYQQTSLLPGYNAPGYQA